MAQAGCPPRLPVELCAVQLSDLGFAFAVTEAAMRGYVEQTWGAWQHDVQFDNHAKSFNPATHQVISVGGAAAGLIAVATTASHVQLEKLYLLPAFRNHGIGSQVLQSVLARAAAQRKPVRLRVLAVNTAAQRFYARHGFVVTDTTAERVFMQSRA